MIILGVNIGHDSAAALIVDGSIVADVAEERFVGVKHYAEFPANAISFCLEKGGIDIESVDVITIPTIENLPNLDVYFDSDRLKAPKRGMKKKIRSYFQAVMTDSQKREPPMYLKKFPISKKTEIVRIDHHLAHAASAYYTSGFNSKTLIVTADGIGDKVSLAIWRGEKGNIKQLNKVDGGGSLGWFYAAVTEALGWWAGDGEGKTMGLAPYGSYEKTKGILNPFIPHYEDGILVKPHDFGTPNNWPEKGAYHWHLPDSHEIAKLVRQYGRENIAAEAQRVLEEEAYIIIKSWLEREKVNQCCCAGGVFLNVKLNQKIWYSGIAENQYIFPNAGDCGLALGAALYAYYSNASFSNLKPIKHVYWGPQFSAQEIKNILGERNLTYKRYENITTKTAEVLAEGKIVAWFQGRMESGPRALGNRSILMSPMKLENKDIINARVKFREAFRPFCPSLLFKAKDEYLVNSREEPFMITSFDSVESKKGSIPAVIHVDGTARPQTVRREVNSRYWDLINEFGKLTGTPVILNTSFNIKGDPIICSPRQAIRCFYDTGLDALVMGDYLIMK